MQPQSPETNSRQKAARYYQSLTVDEFNHVAENIDLFRSGCDWIRNYLAKPHPQLGRTGSVCPFAAPALAKDTLRLAVVRLQPTIDKRPQIVGAINHHREIFLSAAASGEPPALRSTLVLFPDVSLEEAGELIDRTKEELKNSFVEQGLMLGEFHHQNESPGLHNPAFMPLRSPIPMLVIRRMVITDFVFLNRSEYDTATRLRYLETYFKVSGVTDLTLGKEVERVIASLKKELQGNVGA